MSTNTALDDIKARVENALMHQNLDPSVYAELAWDVVAAAPKLLAALDAVEELAASAPRSIGFGGASFSGILIADDVLKLIKDALS